jgi:hypothetical protein
MYETSKGVMKGIWSRRKKNKIILEVLNVEILWQRAIRWKGMHTGKKKRNGRKNWQTGERKRKPQKTKRGGVERFFPLPNISNPPFLCTDKRTRKNCIETEYIYKEVKYQRCTRRSVTRKPNNRFMAFIDILSCHVHRSDVLNANKRNSLQIQVIVQAVCKVS